MARLRQVAVARGALPVRSWEAPSAKVVSRTWCLASIFWWSRQLRELDGGGLLGGQAGTCVDGRDGGLVGLAVGAATLDLDDLAGAVDEQVVHGGDLDPADLRAAVSGAPGAALEGDVLPGKGLQLLAQLLLVPLDDRDAMGPAAQEIGGVIALRMERVAGDHGCGQVGDGVELAAGSG